MKTRRLALVATGLFVVSLLIPATADAGWRWRRARWVSPRTNTLHTWQRTRRVSTGRVTYSGVSRAEQDFWRQRDAWYNHAFNGWKPEDFR